MTGDNRDDPDDRTVMAGEYVLGTLDAAARAAFEQALQSDEALRAEVYAWQDRLLGLADRVAPAEPRAGAWAAIEQALPAAASARVAAPLDAPVSGQAAPAANDPLWQRLRRWQWTGGLAIAASLLLATVLVVRGPATAGERYLAVLQAPDKSTGWLVEVTAGRTVRLLPAGPVGAAPPGKSVQFWTKPQGAAGPTSLGLIQPGTVTELPVSRLPAVGAEQLFELTLEPEGGSPLARPTGPILYVGRTVRL